MEANIASLICGEGGVDSIVALLCKIFCSTNFLRSSCLSLLLLHFVFSYIQRGSLVVLGNVSLYGRLGVSCGEG